MRSNLRAIGRSTIYHLVRPPQRPQSIKSAGTSRSLEPAEASCSRWFSCHHPQCHPSSGEFFSASQQPTSSSPRQHRPRTQLTPEGTNDKEDGKASQQRPGGTHLPLPPSLPYSPDSLPFRRHLEILSIALSFDPETSWTTYTAIHPSLRRFVPNSLYRALFAQQVSDTDNPLIWSRVSELIRFASECQMKMEDLGREHVQQALKIGLEYYLSLYPKDLRDTAEEAMIVWDLWAHLVRWHGGRLSGIRTSTRRLWLELHFARTRKLDKSDDILRRNAAARKALDEMIEGGGIEGLEDIASKIVLSPRRRDTERHLEDLHRLIRIMEVGVDLHKTLFFAVMGRFRAQSEIDGEDGVVTLQKAVEDICQRLGDGPEVQAIHDRLTESLQDIINQYQTTTTERAAAALAEKEPRVAKMLTMVIKIVKNRSSEKDVNLAIRIAIALFDRVAHQRSIDPQIFIAYLLPLMFKLRSDRSIDSAAHITRLGDIFLSSKLLPHIDANFVHMLFYLLIGIKAGPAFRLAIKIYNHARTSDPPLNWTGYRYTVWRKALRRSLATGQDKKPYIHFASRLYADAIADGVQIHQEEVLHIVRKAGATPIQGRHVLLERYMKDYLYFGYGSQPDLARAVVYGLTDTRRAKDAWVAFHLGMRITGPADFPRNAVQRIFGVLLPPGRLLMYRQCGIILQYLPATPESIGLWTTLIDEVLNGELKREDCNSPKRPAPRNRLALALQLYRTMLSKGLKSTPLVIALMTEALVHHKYLNLAVKIANTHVEQGRVLAAFAMRSILVELRYQGRDDEADRLLRDYRAMTMPQEDVDQSGLDSLPDLGVDIVLHRIRGTRSSSDLLTQYGERVMKDAEGRYQRWTRAKALLAEMKARERASDLAKQAAASNIRAVSLLALRVDPDESEVDKLESDLSSARPRGEERPPGSDSGDVPGEKEDDLQGVYAEVIGSTGSEKE